MGSFLKCFSSMSIYLLSDIESPVVCDNQHDLRSGILVQLLILRREKSQTRAARIHPTTESNGATHTGWKVCRTRWWEGFSRNEGQIYGTLAGSYRWSCMMGNITMWSLFAPRSVVFTSLPGSLLPREDVNITNTLFCYERWKSLNVSNPIFAISLPGYHLPFESMVPGTRIRHDLSEE